MTFTSFLDGAFHVEDSPELREKESRLQIWARKEGDGTRVELCEPPFPVVNGVARPHGSTLHFHKRPPELVYSGALVRFLRCRGLRVLSDHPRHTTQVPVYGDFDNAEVRDITYEVRGLVELSKEVVAKGCELGLITLEYELIAGNEDPTPWEYTSTQTYTLLEHFNLVPYHRRN